MNYVYTMLKIIELFSSVPRVIQSFIKIYTRIIPDILAAAFET